MEEMRAVNFIFLAKIIKLLRISFVCRFGGRILKKRRSLNTEEESVFVLVPIGAY